MTAALEISFEERQGSRRFRHPARFDYSENLDHLRPILQDLVDKLATGRSGVL